MKTILDYINEKKENQEWVAISVTTVDSFYSSKEKTTQRVVSYDTYREMKEKGHTKGYMTIKSIEELGPVCKSKEAAMEFLDVPEKKAKKEKSIKEMLIILFGAFLLVL